MRRLKFVLAFLVRISYASTFGGSQNAMAVMWGDKHHVGAARGSMLGEYPRTNKCCSMLFFPAGNCRHHSEHHIRKCWQSSYC